MPPEIYSHAVFGFSEHLDWSTLDFVQPINDIRVCSACRVVARKTAFLACRHVLCEPCYEQWKSRGSPVCFLDGDLCPENEVHWMEFPVEKMQKNQVTCWNRKNGCETITDVSSIAEHFHRDCAYHSTCCHKCTSMVLRKDIIAHLESQCVDYVLRISLVTSPSEGLSKELNDIREGVRGMEMAFRSASDNDVLAVTSFREITETGVENVDHLCKISAEVSQFSQVTKQTLSEVEQSSEDYVSEIEDIKTCKDALCAELEEIQRAADELGACESINQQEIREREEWTETLQVIHKEIQSISNILGEGICELFPEVGVPKSVAVDGLFEVRSYYALSHWSRIHTRNLLLLEATTRVFVNAKYVPVKIVWCLCEWWILRAGIKGDSLISAQTSICFDYGYSLYLTLRNDLIPDEGFRYLLTFGGGNAPNPKSVKLLFMNRKKGATPYEIHLKRRCEYLSLDIFVSDPLTLSDLKRNAIIQGDVLKLCFTFLY
ncbi:uncharacterized protein LOC119164362 isoform X2 [Rhipicephalus microplus]|uniref:uncharacterized protein LOC119164362 isoform X2 n=1 Tax=Rhipicephalus microplus TaxID=6941 RepID=UPI003F6B4003